MKKLLFLCLVAGLGLGTTSHAQMENTTTYSGSFDRDASLISISYGVPNLPLRHQWNNKIGPFYARYEHGIFDYLGVGAYVGIGHGSFSTPAYKDKSTSYGFGAMAYYHFNRFIDMDNLDVFLGAGLAFKGRHNNYSKNSAQMARQKSYFRVTGAIKAGARYYFSPNIGVFGEVGYDGLSIADFGLALKF